MFLINNSINNKYNYSINSINNKYKIILENS